MQIGTRVRYGMLAMMDLAREGGAVRSPAGSAPARAVDIARRHGLSKGYLEGLLAALRRSGLVRAIRGPGGGWVLARSASRIRPLDIYEALEGPTALVPCAEDARLCSVGKSAGVRNAGAGCRARKLWVAMGRALAATLRTDTLAALSGLVSKKRPRKASSKAPKKITKKKPAARKKSATKKNAAKKTATKKSVAKKTATKKAKKTTRKPRLKIAKRPAKSKIVKAPRRRRLRKSA